MSLALRRSVWGSLRSASPFSQSPPTTENNPESDPDMRAISKTLHRVRRKKEDATPKSKKLVRRIPRTITMTAFDAEGRPPPPELDRDVDLVGYLELEADIPPHLVFEKLHPQKDVETCSSALFHLPPNVKHLIYSFCFPEEDSKISLSPHFATKAVFDEEYFASPWDILDPVWGGLATCQELRHELMTYFWTEYHFHVSVNPFSGPRFSPLSHVWLPQYLHRIQCLTIEVDLTRFGGSALKYASSIGFECGKLERLLVDLIEGLQMRSSEVMMEGLIVLSRRYRGNRPVDGTFVTTEDVPWHPNEFSFLRTALSGLCGLVRRCRIAGFPLEYTKALLESMFSNAKRAARLVEPRDSAWPAMPIYEPPVRPPTAFNAYSVVPYKQGDSVTGTTRRGTHGTGSIDQIAMRSLDSLIDIDDTIMPAVSGDSGALDLQNMGLSETASTTHSDWEIALHHSTSFTEMFERGLNGSQESLVSNYTTVRATEDEDYFGHPAMLLINRGHPLLNHGQSYQSLIPQISCSPASTAGHSPRIVTRTPGTIEAPVETRKFIESPGFVQSGTPGIIKSTGQSRRFIELSGFIESPRFVKSPGVIGSPEHAASPYTPCPKPALQSLPKYLETPGQVASPDTPCPKKTEQSPSQYPKTQGTLSAATTWSNVLAEHNAPMPSSRPITPQSPPALSRSNSLLRRLSRSPSSRKEKDSNSPVRRTPTTLQKTRTPQSLKRTQSSPLRATPLTPTRVRKTALPPSMSVMNALNEQDPAFIRTMEALKARESFMGTRPSVDRAFTTPGPRKSAAELGSRPNSDETVGVKKRYTSFFSRLRAAGSA